MFSAPPTSTQLTILWQSI